MLDADNGLYNRHFWWKGSFEVHTNYEEIVAQPICDLCEKLHRSEPRKIYRDIDAWWYNSTQCSMPEDHGIQFRKKEELKTRDDIERPWFLIDD